MSDEHLMGYPSNIGPPDLKWNEMTAEYEKTIYKYDSETGDVSIVQLGQQSVERGLRAVLDEIGWCKDEMKTFNGVPIPRLVEIFQKASTME